MDASVSRSIPTITTSTPSGAVKEIPAYCVNPNDYRCAANGWRWGEHRILWPRRKAADPKVHWHRGQWISRLVRPGANWALRISTKATTRLKWRCGVISSVTLGHQQPQGQFRRSVAWNCSAHRRCSLRQRTSMRRGTAWNEVLSPECDLYAGSGYCLRGHYRRQASTNSRFLQLLVKNLGV